MTGGIRKPSESEEEYIARIEYQRRKKVEEEVRRRGGYLLVIETSSQESYGSTRQFYDKVGCTLAAQLPDYYAKGDDKLIYLKRVL